MMKKAILLLSLSLSVSVFAQEMSLEDRVTELEIQNSFNYFKFSGFLWNRYDSIESKNTTKHTTTKDTLAGLGLFTYGKKEQMSALRLGYGLNVNADISPKLKMYSRIAGQKSYNMWIDESTNTWILVDTGRSYNGGTAAASSTLLLEKAYFDYSISDSFVYSMGRLPTVDGSPAHLWDDRARMGTYPLMSYNSILDGIALTYKLDKMMPTGHHLAFRLIGTPFSSIGAADSYEDTTNYQNHATTDDGLTVPPITDIITMHMDYGLDDSKLANYTNIILQSWTGKFAFPDNLGSSGDSKLNILATVTTLNAEFDRLFDSNFDIVLSVISSSLKSMGSYDINETGSAPAGDVDLPGYDIMGYGNSTGETKTVTGAMSMASLRYRIIPSTYLGVEVLSASKNFFYYAGAQTDLTSFYITPGEANHVYITHKLEPNLTIRIGQMSQQYKYNSLTFGETEKNDAKVATTYANLRLDF